MLMLSRWRLAGLWFCSFAILAAACGGGDEIAPGAPPPPPIPPRDSGPLPPDDSGLMMQPVGGSCVEGDMKDCKVLLPSHGPIHPCFVGVQICTDKKWGPCVDPPPDAGRGGGDGSAVN